METRACACVASRGFTFAAFTIAFPQDRMRWMDENCARDGVKGMIKPVHSRGDMKQIRQLMRDFRLSSETEILFP